MSKIKWIIDLMNINIFSTTSKLLYILQNLQLEPKAFHQSFPSSKDSRNLQDTVNWNIHFMSIFKDE